jgi:hypothetical protein
VMLAFVRLSLERRFWTVAGPYSAEVVEQRQHNLDALNKVAAAVMNRDHIPVVGGALKKATVGVSK